MSVKIRAKRQKLYLDIYHRGTRKWEPLGITLTDDKAHNREALRVAEICRAKRELQLVSGEWDLIDHTSGKITLYEYLKKVMTDKNYISVMKVLEKFPNGKITQIGNISEKWIRDFQDYLIKDCGLSGTTPHTYSTVLRTALNRAVREKIIMSNPARNVRKPPMPDTHKVYLAPEEIQAIASAVMLPGKQQEVQRGFLFGCFTGLRISDIKTLKWGDIERSSLQIIKRQKKTQDNVYIPLNETAWKIIDDKKLHDLSEPVFPCLDKEKRLSPSIRIIKLLAKRAGVKKNISWHSARHTFAVLSLESGAEIYTVSKLLGHRSLKTTQVYAKATDKMKRAAVDALPSIELNKASGGVYEFKPKGSGV